MAPELWCRRPRWEDVPEFKRLSREFREDVVRVATNLAPPQLIAADFDITATCLQS